MLQAKVIPSGTILSKWPWAENKWLKAYQHLTPLSDSSCEVRDFMESKSLLFPCMGFPLPKVPLPEAGAGGKREDRMLKMKGCESGRD